MFYTNTTCNSASVANQAKDKSDLEVACQRLDDLISDSMRIDLLYNERLTCITTPAITGEKNPTDYPEDAPEAPLLKVMKLWIVRIDTQNESRKKVLARLIV